MKGLGDYWLGVRKLLMNPDFCLEQQTIVVLFCEIKLEEEPRAEHEFFRVEMVGGIQDDGFSFGYVEYRIP